MDLGMFGSITFDLVFLSALFSIVIIDLILAGDNAVVIAMAVGRFPAISAERASFSGRARRSFCAWSSRSSWRSC